MPCDNFICLPSCRRGFVVGIPVNIGIFIHECYAEFDLENCIDEFADELRNQPLANKDTLFFVFEQNDVLVNSTPQIRVYGQSNHPPIDILLVSRQSLSRQTPTSNTRQWLQKTAQSAQLIVGLFAANKLLAELAIIADLIIVKAQPNATRSRASQRLKQRTNSRWQSHVMVHLKQSLPSALLSSLHLIHQLETSGLVCQSNKQLQLDL